MQDYLIVDGYNIIYAWPQFERFTSSEIEHARSRLVAILADYASVQGQKVVVVFDAYRRKSAADRTEFDSGVEVIYTKHGETADTLIERLAGELLTQGNVYVATSDWAEQGIIFGRGAYRITPGELLTRVNEVKAASKKLMEMSGPLDNYLENRLNNGDIRQKLEQWRRSKE